MKPRGLRHAHFQVGGNHTFKHRSVRLVPLRGMLLSYALHMGPPSKAHALQALTSPPHFPPKGALFLCPLQAVPFQAHALQALTSLPYCPLQAALFLCLLQAAAAPFQAHALKHSPQAPTLPHKACCSPTAPASCPCQQRLCPQALAPLPDPPPQNVLLSYASCKLF